MTTGRSSEGRAAARSRRAPPDGLTLDISLAMGRRLLKWSPARGGLGRNSRRPRHCDADPSEPASATGVAHPSLAGPCGGVRPRQDGMALY